MPFIPKASKVINGGGIGAYPDVDHSGIPDAAESLTDGVHTITTPEVLEMEEDIVDLENNKMNKTDAVDGGGF